MKPLTFILFFCLVLFACHHRQTSSSGAAISDSLAQKTLGIYSGKYGKGMMTLVVNYVGDHIVSGYDVYKGRRRNLVGTGMIADGGMLLLLKEPGDLKSDGKFTVHLDTTSFKLSGKWNSMDSGKSLVRQVDLSRRVDTLSLETTSWGGGSDSTLEFKTDRTCSFTFYERPDDSTSQAITVRGNYEFDRAKKTYHIDWEKNDHLKQQSMTLVMEVEKADGYEYPSKLKGSGMEFYLNEGD